MKPSLRLPLALAFALAGWPAFAAAGEVAQLGQQRVAKEAKSRERLGKGELGVDISGLRTKLKELGVEYFDQDPG